MTNEAAERLRQLFHDPLGDPAILYNELDAALATERQRTVERARPVIEGMGAVIQKWMPRRALVEMPQHDLDAISRVPQKFLDENGGTP